MDSKETRIRLAILAKFSPKKLGSGEDSVLAFARAARMHGISWTLFCYQPIHPVLSSEFDRLGVTVENLADLERRPFSAWRFFRRNYDVIQLNLIPPRGAVAIAAYLAWPAKVLFVDRVSGEPISHRSAPNLLTRLLDRVTMLRVEKFIGVSEYVRKRGEARFGLPEERTDLQYNGISIERYQLIAEQRETVPASEEVSIVSVGSLIPEKGMDVLIKALAKVSNLDWRMAIAGEGPEATRLRDLADGLGIGHRVDLLGLRDDVDQLLKNADIFVHPAVWEEAFGHTVVEGMVSGCCVLASRVGGIPELCEDQKEGILLPPGDVEAWANALERCLSDAQLRKALGEAARRRVLRDFTIDRRVAKEIALIKECC